ncbi:MAG: serine/threonine protein kinase [Planctomycetaceae bacterium]|nr:serine/threonine protein kinase [Planctomycetaceae bacterium]
MPENTPSSNSNPLDAGLEAAFVSDEASIASRTEVHPSSDYQPGDLLVGRYRLMQRIGQGGMGAVWLAEQKEPVKRKVAVKLVKAGMDTRAVLARFEAERQALAMMEHPNIAKVLDGGVTEKGRPFFVMELVKGIPLTDYCDQVQFSIRERLELFGQVCSAVQHAHQKGIIHRDLKPTNVLVTEVDGRPVVKVIDFGLAKAIHGSQVLTDQSLHTAFGAVLGTPLYMAPEQLGTSALDVDTRADLYSLGVILYELLTGTTPIERQQLKQAAFEEMCRLIREQEPPRPSTRISASDTLPSLAVRRHAEPAKLTRLVRGELDWIVMKALEKDRNRRYETASGFALDIQRYLAGEAVLAAPPSRFYRIQKFVLRYRGAVLAISLLILTLIGGICGTSLGMYWAKTAEASAEQLLVEANKARRIAEDETAAKKVALEEEFKQRQISERNLNFAKRSNEILGSVFATLDPSGNYRTVSDLRDSLAKNIQIAIRQLEDSEIGDPLDVAEIKSTLGRSLLGLGRANEAIPLFEMARETNLNLLGPNHRTTLSTACNLATCFSESGQQERAILLLEEIVPRMNELLGTHHIDTLTTTNNLAMLYRENDQVDKAQLLAENTLKLASDYIGHDHQLTLTCLNNLAMCHFNKHEFALALPLLEQALERMRVNLGPEHPETLNTQCNIGLVYLNTNRIAAAVNAFEETLVAMQIQLGHDHPLTLGCLNNLAGSYRNSGRLEEAINLSEQCYQLTKAKLGEDHNDTLNSLNNWGTALWKSGQFDRSVPLFEMLLPKLERKLGRDHPETLAAIVNLGINYMDAGRLDESIPLLEEIHRASRKRKDLAWIRDRLGRAYVLAGRRESFLSLGQEVVDTAITNHRPRSHELAMALFPTAEQYFTLKLWAESATLLREVVPVLEENAPNSWQTFQAKWLLGVALVGLAAETRDSNESDRIMVEADHYLTIAHQGLVEREPKVPTQAFAGLTMAISRLIELYDQLERPQAAKKWQEVREALQVEK